MTSLNIVPTTEPSSINMRKTCFVILCPYYIEDRKKGLGRDRGRDSTCAQVIDRAQTNHGPGPVEPARYLSRSQEN